MSSDGDRDLEHRFLDARAADAHRVPSFASVLAPRHAQHRRLRLRFVLALAAGVALAAAGIWRLSTPNAPAPVLAFTPGDMRVPTDYLLDLATYPRAGEIPRIGDADWYPIPLASDARPDTRRRP
jgi:hypothetical protein